MSDPSPWQAAQDREKLRQENQSSRNYNPGERKKYKPYRAFLTPGETRQFIILDKSIGEVNAPTDHCFIVDEHNIADPANDGKITQVTCLGRENNCPLCEQANNTKNNYSRQVVLMTVIDLKPYPKGGEIIPFSRKVLAIPMKLADKFKRIEESSKRQHGTLRGARIVLSRSLDRKSASCGEPVEFAPEHFPEGTKDIEKFLDKKFIHYSEESLLKRYGRPARVGKDGTVYAEENSDIRCVDYEEFYGLTDENINEICEKYGNGRKPKQSPYEPRGQRAPLDEDGDDGFFDDKSGRDTDAGDDIPF